MMISGDGGDIQPLPDETIFPAGRLDSRPVGADPGLTSAEDDGDDDWLVDPRPAPFDPAPEAVRDRCLEAIEAWPVHAVGRRPADWLAHDLLVSRLLADARLSYFHRLLKEPEP